MTNAMQSCWLCVHKQNRYRFGIGERISAKQHVGNEIQILLKQRDKVLNDSRNKTKIDSRMYDWFVRLCSYCVCVYIYVYLFISLSKFKSHCLVLERS